MKKKKKKSYHIPVPFSAPTPFHSFSLPVQLDELVIQVLIEEEVLTI
jgi:hypothetical protein